MKNLICFLMFLVCCAAKAQTISGKVTDSKGEPLPYTTIYIEALRISTVADADGLFQLKAVPDGKHTVAASFIGYHRQEHQIELNGSATVDFSLEEANNLLYEVVVLPNGMDMCQYVMQQIDKHRKPLKKFVESYDCTTTARVTKEADLENMKHRRAIRLALWVAGWAKIFDIFVKYPKLMLEFTEEVHFKKGRMSNDGVKISAVEPALPQKELDILGKKDWFLDLNTFDKFYDKLHEKIKEIRKEGGTVEYIGSYDEGDRTVYVLKHRKIQMEVVSGCWQIRRMTYTSGIKYIYLECAELVPGLYLPISGIANLAVDSEKHRLKGTAKTSVSFRYRNLIKADK